MISTKIIEDKELGQLAKDLSEPNKNLDRMCNHLDFIDKTLGRLSSEVKRRSKPDWDI